MTGFDRWHICQHFSAYLKQVCGCVQFWTHVFLKRQKRLLYTPWPSVNRVFHKMGTRVIHARGGSYRRDSRHWYAPHVRGGIPIRWVSLFLRRPRAPRARGGIPQNGHTPFSHAFIINPQKWGDVLPSLAFLLLHTFPNQTESPLNRFYYHSRFFDHDSCWYEHM